MNKEDGLTRQQEENIWNVQESTTWLKKENGCQVNSNAVELFSSNILLQESKMCCLMGHK